jgi:sterol desaturase/sphingolipid hydroxylase (fatty acid hydroxylase superfamily)
MFDNQEIDLTIYFIPVFILLIAIEVGVNLKRKLKLYEFQDSIACITMGLGVVVIGIFTKVFYYYFFSILFEYRFFTLENNWWMWVLLVFADDFSFYWHHRLSHHVRILWAAHVQHHSSQKLNLSVALRQSWGEPFYKFLFYMWMPILGFDPIYIIMMQAISLIYQFFQHTDLVKSLGLFELFMNTPSHHRVHHAVQAKYLDRNHAGIFIIWDKIFGTFVAEDNNIKPIYGITNNIDSHNPINIATHEYRNIIKEVRNTNGISNKLKLIFYPPGWDPKGDHQTSAAVRKKLEENHLYPNNFS